jgi:heterodisulfide reductase subunit A
VLSLADKSVVVIGGGIAGLTAARQLAGLGITVELIEKTPFLGGHAIQFACKATERCVKCGACMVEEALQQVLTTPNIALHTGCQVKKVTRQEAFAIECDQQPAVIDTDKCTDCGICFEKCPADGAILQGTSGLQRPFYALSRDHCLYYQDKSCTLCQEACPEGAIQLNQDAAKPINCQADAVVLATGFAPYDPTEKPYGYGHFKNVITNLELDRLLRRQGALTLPSDGATPEKIGFVQCVGSRDAKCNHLWCSKICCGSALRAAHLIKSRHPDIQICFFYIDIQTFGKDFDTFYNQIRSEIELIRAIPGDFFETEESRILVNYFDPQAHDAQEEAFDLMVLSVGLTPSQDIQPLAKMLALDVSDTGFAPLQTDIETTSPGGVYTAGSVTGPMSIPESMENACKTVYEIAHYLNTI